MVFFAVLALAPQARSQSGASAPLELVLEPFSPPLGRLIVEERSDFSRYDNGVYVGHVYREARLDLVCESLAGGVISWEGEALVLEETLRDLHQSARRLDGNVAVAFRSSASGPLVFSRDEGYPILRGIPLSPPHAARVGQTWTGSGVVVVRPNSDSPATRIPVLVEYEFAGKTVWSGQDAYLIKARYGVRYKGTDRQGDPSILSSMGGRTADIIVAAADGSTLFIRETVDETYTYQGGQTVRLKGFILHFHRGSLPADRDRIALALGGKPAAGTAPGLPEPAATTVAPASGGLPSGSAAESKPAVVPPATTPDKGQQPATTAANPIAPAVPGSFEVVSSKRGTVLLLFDLRFAPDSAELLPGEKGRLDAIAQALLRVPDRTFLVEGHTADTGKPQGQLILSEQRAKRVVDELVARGIPAGRFVYRGLGASVPLAPNDTEQNRARNRRVEITILD